MFNSTILDVAAGLIFTFFAVSLAAGAITEAFAAALRWRSRTLRSGIQDLLNDQAFTGLARAIYQHALVNPRQDGSPQAGDRWSKLPAYIDPAQFAKVFTEVTGVARATHVWQLRDAVQDITDPQIRSFLTGVVDRTGHDLAAVRDEVAAWFDNAMDRLSGGYKRWTQVVTFAVALAIAGAFDLDTIGIGRALWVQPSLARYFEANKDLPPADAIEKLRSSFPIGWSPRAQSQATTPTGTDPWPWFWRTILEPLFGILITAFAALFGAPFWFDALQTVVRLKGAGPSPREKAADAAASR